VDSTMGAGAVEVTGVTGRVLGSQFSVLGLRKNRTFWLVTSHGIFSFGLPGLEFLEGLWDALIAIWSPGKKL
jgi:hypothetical protein